MARKKAISPSTTPLNETKSDESEDCSTSPLLSLIAPPTTISSSTISSLESIIPPLSLNTSTTIPKRKKSKKNFIQPEQTPLQAISTSSQIPPYIAKDTTSEKEIPPSSRFSAYSPTSPLLCIEEKRRWLAQIVRNKTGWHEGFELSLNDKFKALIEDTKLADLEANSSATKNHTKEPTLSELLKEVLAGVPTPVEQRFSPHHT